MNTLASPTPSCDTISMKTLILTMAMIPLYIGSLLGPIGVGVILVATIAMLTQ